MSSDFEAHWTKEDIKQLIELYEEHENLYNSKHRFYHNKHCRIDSLNKILKNLNADRTVVFNIDDIKKKMLSLRTTLNKERKLVEQNNKSGRGAEEIYEPTIWWYDTMQYMVPYLKSRQSESPLEIPLAINVTNIKLF